MEQPSIASFFPNRKRVSPEELKTRGSKVLLLDSEDVLKGTTCGKIVQCDKDEAKLKANNDKKKQIKAALQKRLKDNKNQPDLQDLFNKMTRKIESEKMDIDPEEKLKTPPPSPTKKVNLMDKVKEPSLKEIKDKINKSSRLAELKASLARFKEGQAKLDKKPEPKKVTDTSTSKAQIQLVNNLRKETVAKKSLFKTKSTESLIDQKTSLAIPYKYRTLAELFRSIDTVCQIMHNRKETITFKKLKPAVEELIKKNINLSHLAQIKALYPDAYKYKQEKIRAFGAGINQEKWELTIEPVVEESMTSQVLLERRRKLYNIIIERLKGMHRQFLATLDPPMVIAEKDLKRWHPEFDLERVLDVEEAELPQPPHEEKLSTGKDVLEKVKAMFNCNTRMEAALEKLKKVQETQTAVEEPKKISSILKGIPKALLEKVRQKQAAKALEAMTKCEAKEKEIQMYGRLPEFVRLTRNLFVAERKSVLPIDTVLDKLSNSIRTYIVRSEIETHLRTIAKEVPTWMVFHSVRNGVFIKILKDAEIDGVCYKLAVALKNKRAGN